MVDGINTLNEKSLHAGLKQWYALEADLIETPVDGFIIDLVRGELLIEIQTGSFHPLKRKLAKLTQTHPVRLVYPIAVEKWLVNQAEAPEAPPIRRKSPKRGCVQHLFGELVYIPALLANPNFTLEVLLIREEELRRPNDKKRWRSKDWVTEERRLLEVLDRRVFNTPTDLIALVPPDLKQPFTARELAKSLHQPTWLGYKMIYCLKALGLVAEEERRGRSKRPDFR